jgi:DNA-binding response OmpR family regulator
MNLESLLLSADPEVERVLRPTLEKLAIDVEICRNARHGSEMLLSEKFDAVIVDCDDMKGGMEILQGLRNTPSNRNSITFAILSGNQTTTQEVFGMGVNFVLQKPLSGLNASRCFNAALNYMLRERRRYFRQPVKTQVHILVGDQRLRATSSNLSEGGMAVMLREAMPKGTTPRIKFTLPGIKSAFEMEAEVAWSDLKGSAGFRFKNVPASSQAILEQWLNEQMAKEIPAAKESLSADSESAH